MTTSVLDDHRRLAARTVVVVGCAVAAISVALVVAGRGRLALGVVAGGAVAAFDVALLARGLTRFGRASEGIGGGALTAALLSRFAIVGTLLGLVMAARALAPVAVIVGFLTLPVGLVTVGFRAIRHRPDVGGARRPPVAR